MARPDRASRPPARAVSGPRLAPVTRILGRCTGRWTPRDAARAAPGPAPRRAGHLRRPGARCAARDRLGALVGGRGPRAARSRGDRARRRAAPRGRHATRRGSHHRAHDRRLGARRRALRRLEAPPRVGRAARGSTRACRDPLRPVRGAAPAGAARPPRGGALPPRAAVHPRHRVPAAAGAAPAHPAGAGRVLRGGRASAAAQRRARRCHGLRVAEPRRAAGGA